MAHQQQQNNALGNTPGQFPRMLAYQLKYFNELSLNLARMLKQQKETLPDGILVVDEGVTTPLLNLFLDGIKLPGRSVTRFFNRRNEATRFAYTAVFTPQFSPQLRERVERGSPEALQRSLALMKMMFEDTSIFNTLTQTIKQSEHYKDSAFFKRDDCTQAAKQALAGVWLFIPSAGAPPPQQWLPTPQPVGHDMPAVPLSKAKPKKTKKGKAKAHKKRRETNERRTPQNGVDTKGSPNVHNSNDAQPKPVPTVPKRQRGRSDATRQKPSVGADGELPDARVDEEEVEKKPAEMETEGKEGSGSEEDATEDQHSRGDARQHRVEGEPNPVGGMDSKDAAEKQDQPRGQTRGMGHDQEAREQQQQGKNEEREAQEEGEHQQQGKSEEREAPEEEEHQQQGKNEEREAPEEKEHREQRFSNVSANSSISDVQTDSAHLVKRREDDSEPSTAATEDDGERSEDAPATAQHDGSSNDEEGDDDARGFAGDNRHEDDDNYPNDSDSSGESSGLHWPSADQSETSGDGSWFAQQLQSGSLIQWLHERVSNDHNPNAAAQGSGAATINSNTVNDSGSNEVMDSAAGVAGEGTAMSGVLAKAEASSLEFEATEYAVVYENHRCFFKSPARAIHRVPGVDRPLWSDKDGNRLPPKDEYPLPEHHEWVGEWRIDMEQPCDEDGWQYASIASSTYTGSRSSLNTFRRRRKWVRAMKRTTIKYSAMLQDPVVRGFLGDVTWRDRVDDIVAFILEQPMKLYQTVTTMLPFHGDANVESRHAAPQQDTVWRTRVIPASTPVSRTASTHAPVPDGGEDNDSHHNKDDDGASTGHCTIDIEFVDVNPNIELLTVKNMFAAAPNVGYRTEEEVTGDIDRLNRMIEEQQGWCARCRRALTIIEPAQPLQYCGVCFFTGKICCAECMHPERVVIPWRAIEFCDFKAYSVNMDAGEGLALLAVRPMYNWSVFAASTENSYEADYPSMAHLASTGRPQLERGFGLMEALHSQLMERIDELGIDMKSISTERLQRASEFLYRNPHFLQDTLIFTMDNLRDLIAEVQDGQPRLTREMREAMQNVAGLQSPPASFLPFRFPFC